MKFRESEPDYENTLRGAGWSVYVGLETIMQDGKVSRWLKIYATKFNDRVKVVAEQEQEHGAWRELFELALQIDSTLRASNT